MICDACGQKVKMTSAYGYGKCSCGIEYEYDEGTYPMLSMKEWEIALKAVLEARSKPPEEG